MKRFLPAALSALAVALEALPWGAVLVFTDGDDQRRLLFSYFDPTPFGYANFAPLLTAVASVMLLVTALIFWGKNKGGKFLRVLAGAAFLLSLLPLFRGFSHLSLCGILISLTLLAVTMLSFCRYPASEKAVKKGSASARKRRRR